MTHETNEQTHPTNKTFRVSAAGIQVYVNSTAEVVNLVHELATKFGKLLPVQPNRPMHTEGIISRSDGALVCLEYRFAATPEHLETQPSTVPCRYCGRPVSPVGGRWSANPLVQKHLSGPLAYDERKIQIPTLAYQQLMRGGCVPPISEKQPVKQVRPAHETEAKSEPVEIPPPPKPALKRVDEKPAGSLKVTKSSAPDEQAKTADVPPEKQSSKELPLPVNATFNGCDLGQLSSEKQIKRPWAAPKVKKPPAAPVVKSETQPKTDLKSAVAPTTPARTHSGVRLMKTPGQPISQEATRFHRMRSDLGVPASAVAQEASLMLAEMQGLESGEIAPEEGKEAQLWAELTQAMQRAARKEAAMRIAGAKGGGSPAQKASPRTTTTFF